MTTHIPRKVVCTIIMLPALAVSAQQPGSTRQPDTVRLPFDGAQGTPVDGVHGRPFDSAQGRREAAATLVARIQRADYEGDRSALQRLHDELAPFSRHKDLAPRVRYWQGFALLRLVFNGFNEAADPKALEPDVRQALGAFEDGARQDPAFVDAKVGVITCLQTLLYLNRNDAARVQEFVSRILQLFKEALSSAPDNPRLLSALGIQQWYSPPEQGGGQDIAMATFDEGLQAARMEKGRAKDALEPSWGEPELLMNLAWTNLSKKTPDVRAAEEYAKHALELVPYWHYVRDILMPKIQNAKEKS